MNPSERARKIRLLIMDVDGVWTDGKLYYVPGGDNDMCEVKGFNTQDGMGLSSPKIKYSGDAPMLLRSMDIEPGSPK